MKDHHLSSGNIFSAVQCSAGYSRCKVFAKVIDKYLLGIGKLVPFKAMHILRYFQVKCALESFRKARLASNVIACGNGVDGYDKLCKTNKSLIKEFIAKENSAVLKSLPQKPYTQKTKSLQIPPKLRKENLASSQVPAIQVMFTNADQLTSSKMT